MKSPVSYIFAYNFCREGLNVPRNELVTAVSFFASQLKAKGLDLRLTMSLNDTAKRSGEFLMKVELIINKTDVTNLNLKTK